MGKSMMDVRDAWNFLAELWKDVGDDRVASPNKEGFRTCAGLCPCITTLESMGEITGDEAYQMKEAIWKLPEWIDPEGNGNSQGFRWPPNEEGAKQRVEFCLKMAQES